MSKPFFDFRKFRNWRARNGHFGPFLAVFAVFFVFFHIAFFLLIFNMMFLGIFRRGLRSIIMIGNRVVTSQCDVLFNKQALVDPGQRCNKVNDLIRAQAQYSECQKMVFFCFSLLILTGLCFFIINIILYFLGNYIWPKWATFLTSRYFLYNYSFLIIVLIIPSFQQSSMNEEYI